MAEGDEEYTLDGATTHLSPIKKEKSFVFDKPAKAPMDLTFEERMLITKERLKIKPDIKFKELTVQEKEDAFNAMEQYWKKKAVENKWAFEHSDWKFRGIHKQGTDKISVFEDMAQKGKYHFIISGGKHPVYFHFEDQHAVNAFYRNIGKSLGFKLTRRKSGGDVVYIGKK